MASTLVSRLAHCHTCVLLFRFALKQCRERERMWIHNQRVATHGAERLLCAAVKRLEDPKTLGVKHVCTSRDI